MDIAKPISKNLGFFNARQKYYPEPNGERRLVEVMVFSEAVYNPRHLERISPGRKKISSDEFADEAEDKATADTDDESNKNKCSDYGVRRARRRLFDLVSCNPECNMMVTLTLNGEDFPRDEWSAIIPKLSTWLDNATRRRGMKYILVPEYHKDGKSIHFHGFINESALALARAINPNTGKPIKQGGRAVYNVENWKYGFTTAVRVGKSDLDQSSSAKYVLKYITKNSDKIGGRYYLHGGDLKEPTYEYFNADFAQIGGESWSEFSIGDKLSCKICNDFEAEPNGSESKWEVL